MPQLLCFYISIHSVTLSVALYYDDIILLWNNITPKHVQLSNLTYLGRSKNVVTSTLEARWLTLQMSAKKDQAMLEEMWASNSMTFNLAMESIGSFVRREAKTWHLPINILQMYLHFREGICYFVSLVNVFLAWKKQLNFALWWHWSLPQHVT